MENAKPFKSVFVDLKSVVLQGQKREQGGEKVGGG
jgi:hypothetical protein